MNTIVLNSQNYRDYLPLDIAAFDFAFGGAMGDGGGVNIITQKGDTYYFNYARGDINGRQMMEILPIMEKIHLPMFGETTNMPAGWRHISLGMGNNLLIKEEYVEPLKKSWKKFSQTERGKKCILYNVWFELVLEIIDKRINPEGWNAQDWLNRFGIAQQHRDTHSVRAEVFQCNVRLVEAGTYVSENRKMVDLSNYLNPNNITDNIFYDREIQLQPQTTQYDTKYEVVEQDCLAFAHQLLQADSTDDLAILNMASASNPGGGVYGGAGAQEEYLFRCSDYYRFLFQYAISFDCRSYDIAPHPQHRYPLDRNFGGVYTHGVTIFRDTEAKGYPLIDKPWHANFIAVAACNLRREERGEQIPSYLIETTQNKIRTILRIAAANNQTRLVLGALGCGAFGNPPRHIAELFHDILREPEFYTRFREVYFAILKDHNDQKGNYQHFKEVFK